jgi:hypothetical protein
VRSIERVATRRGALPAAKVGSGATICLRARHHPERKGESCSRAPRPTGSAGHPGHRKWWTRGNPSPVTASAQPRYAGAQIRRDQPDPCAVPVSFQCRAELGRVGEDAKEALVRGRRFAAVDANAHLIPRCGVSPSCQKVRTVIKSLSVCPRGHHCCLGWADLARVGYASITFPQWRSVDFLPLRWHAFLAMPRKSPARHPPLTLRPRAVRVDRPSAC